jgi:hypothetical protein
MRKFLLGAAALAAIAAPGIASAEHNGYVGLDYASTDTGASNGDQRGFGASGSIVITPNVALDAAFLENDGDPVWNATGHLFTNNSSHLLGGFIGLGGDADDNNVWSAGLEGQLYTGNLTWAAALGYASSDSDIDTWGVNGEARYFINENFRLEGGLGWFTSEDESGAVDDNALSAGVGAEYQLSSAPVSFGLSYSQTNYDEGDTDVDTIAATLRINFGGGTLLDRDHSGADLAGLSTIGSFGL